MYKEPMNSFQRFVKEDLLHLAIPSFFLIFVAVNIVGIYYVDKSQTQQNISKEQACKEVNGKWNGYICQTTPEYCRRECNLLFTDLIQDHVSTSHADTISKSVLECVNQCIENE